MLPLLGSELVLTRRSRRREEQNYEVGSTAPMFSTLLSTGKKKSSNGIYTEYHPSPPPLLITTSFHFLYSHSDFSLFSQIHSFSSFYSSWQAIPLPPPPHPPPSVFLECLAPNLFPYSALSWYLPKWAEAAALLLNSWLVRLPLSLLRKEVLIVITG